MRIFTGFSVHNFHFYDAHDYVQVECKTANSIQYRKCQVPTENI